MTKFIPADQRNSFYDGIFANIFATLTGGAFLTGFALHMGMNELMIGILAAMPFLATVFQLPTSYIIQNYGKRKNICIIAAAAARFLWVPILIIGLYPNLANFPVSTIVFSLIFLSYVFISISFVSWQSWMSDLIPDKILGTFFGTRNMICGAAGMIAMILYGRSLDLFKFHFNNGMSLGLSVTFLSAVLFGMISIRYLNKVSDPPSILPSRYRSFRKSLVFAIHDTNFRKFLLFSFAWSFSVHFASPFLTLYSLRELNFSYSFVTVLGTFSALADLVGMRIWGRLSDKIKNKAVIQFAGWFAVFIPFWWIFVRPGSLLTPIILYITAGCFWAGINLCTNNLLLRIPSQEFKNTFFSIYYITAGIGSAVGPILAGLLIKSLVNLHINFNNWTIYPIYIIFFLSTLMRLISLQLLKYIHEPEEVSVGQLVRILRNIRGLDLANGFHSLLHPFIEIVRRENQKQSDPKTG